jgi:amidase
LTNQEHKNAKFNSVKVTSAPGLPESYDSSLSLENKAATVPPTAEEQSKKHDSGMRFPEYEDFDATTLAYLVKNRVCSPLELLEAAIERIEAYNPELNAVVDRLYERARKRVQSLPDGPFKGVPFLVKNLGLTVAGTATSSGNRLAARIVADRSSVLAQRYENAGLQIIGKTNTPEFGIMGITEPALYGACRNPWHAAHTSGGSSGGSAAAVAAGMVPMAHGGDGGGSIRIPSSCCGLFGLKPTRGRVTMAPHYGESWCGLVQEHVLTRSVRDSAAMLDIEAIPTIGEPYAAPAQNRPWVEELTAPARKLRIAYTAEALLAGTTHPDCKEALHDAVGLLRELGHEVEEACPDFSRAELSRAYLVIVACNISFHVKETARMAGVRPRAQDFEPTTWLLSVIGDRCSGSELIAAQTAVHRASRDLASFFQRYDLFMTPTLAQPPLLLGATEPTLLEALQVGFLNRFPLKKALDVALEAMGSQKLAPFPNTQVFNLTGQPAMSVPLHWSKAGLPIGIQFAARFADEATLFRLAAQLEEARPWAHKRPKRA